MRALLLEQPSPIESKPLAAADVPIPALQEDSVLIRVHACGVCHTDLHEIEGELPVPGYPVIPGHQVVGTVVECGKAVSRPQPGTKVGAAGWLLPEALRVMDKGGTLALAGIYMTPSPPLDYEKHLYHEKTVRSVANATRQDGRELLELAAEIPVRTEIESYRLEEANSVLLRLKQGSVQGAAVLQIS